MLTGTVVGLLPGINTLEVFKNAGRRNAVAGTQGGAARRRRPLACSAASFPASALPVPEHGRHLGHAGGGDRDGAGALPGHRHRSTQAASATRPPRRAGEPLHLRHQLAGAPARRLEQQVPHAGRRRHRRQRAGHHRAAAPGLCGRGQRFRPQQRGQQRSARRRHAPRSAPTTWRGSTSPTTRSTSPRATPSGWSRCTTASGPQYSYFEGCSMGGREAMMVTQRLPSYFDGSVSGDPAFRITKVGVWAAYEGQQLAALARTRGPDLRLRRAVRQQHFHQPGPAARLERDARRLRHARRRWSTAW